jgi:hypothetical protein
MKTPYTLLQASILSLAAASAFADDAPVNQCKQPPIPSDQASDVVVKYFNKHRLEYKSCIDKFVEDQKAVVQANSTANPQKAQAAYDAAEKAQKEYNDFVDALNQHAKDQEEKQ